MDTDPLVDLHSRVSTVEYAITEIKDAIKDIRNATKVMSENQAELRPILETIKNHEDRLRAVETAQAEARGIKQLLAWIGPVPLLALLGIAAWLAVKYFSR